jgi:hypothetical protein
MALRCGKNELLLSQYKDHMKNYFHSLKLKDVITLAGLIIIGFGWLLIDQILLSESYQRFIAFFILIFTLFYLQFSINKPEHVFHYANSIALITLSFIVLVSLVMHVIINNDFTFKSVLIWIISGSVPYIVGFIYQKTKK